MKPKELINKYVQDHLVDELSSFGFKYSQSKIEFRKRVGPFTQKFYFSRSKWNQENITVDFWTIWSVESNFYSKWHNEKYGCKPMNNLIYSEYDRYLKGWDKKYMNEIDHYELLQKNPNKLMTHLKWNILNVGIPKLDKYSSWQDAANETIKDEKMWKCINASDYFIINGCTDKGFEPLLNAKEFFLKELGDSNDEYFQDRLKEIDLRIQKNYTN